MTNEHFDDFDTQIQCEELIPAGMEDLNQEALEAMGVEQEEAAEMDENAFYPTETPLGEMYGDGFDDGSINE